MHLSILIMFHCNSWTERYSATEDIIAQFLICADYVALHAAPHPRVGEGEGVHSSTAESNKRVNISGESSTWPLQIKAPKV